MRKKEFCIMPKNEHYSTERFIGSERHEIFEGRTGNRKKSIEDGLVIFLTAEMHRTGKKSIHLNPKYWKEELEIQKIAQEAWCKYYLRSKDDFRKRYGKNYL